MTRRPAVQAARQATLTVRVVPRAAHNRVEGWQDGVLKVRLQAPPVEGRANAALADVLARALGIGRGNVDILRGETARTKLVRITGLDADDIRERLGTFTRRPA